MRTNQKIEDLKDKTAQGIEDVKNLHLSDVKKFYKRFLLRLPDISHLRNIVLFGAIATLLILFLFSQRFASLYAYLPKTPVSGGTYEEGVVGKIEQLNPLFSPTNSAEQAAVSLIFSGLTKKDGSRNTVSDLAEKWEISPDGKSYTFHLKSNVLWHDGQRLTSDDIVFTVNTVQNPDSRSPLLEVWKGVEASSPDENTVVFKLSQPFAPFIANTDLPILPRHMLEAVPARNLKVAEFNKKPIGTGPFKFEELMQIREYQELTLDKNEVYYEGEPYLSRLVIKTYENEAKMLEGYAKKEILGVEHLLLGESKQKQKLPNLKTYEVAIPEYDVLYFNLRKGLTKEKVIREAILLAVDRNKIREDVFAGEATVIYSPILPGYLGYNPKLKSAPNIASAKEKLAVAGFVPDADGILKKGDTRLSLNLYTTNDEQKTKEAESILEMLKMIGMEVKIEKMPMGALIQGHIRPRDFDMLLVSQNLGADPDLYPFWHSSQVNDPGLNFSGFSDRRVDKYLEMGRSNSDPKIRSEKYAAATDIIWGEVPAVFLVRPSWLYGVSRDVKGIIDYQLIDPKNRFWDIEKWYILERRA